MYSLFQLLLMNEFFVQLMGNQERLGKRKVKNKHHLAFLLCKHTSFLVCGCFLFLLPALTCTLTAEAVSWSMRVPDLGPSLSPFPRDYCNPSVLKLRINQPFLVLFQKKLWQLQTDSVQNPFSQAAQKSFPEKPPRVLRQNGVLFLNSCVRQALQMQTHR